MRIPPRFLMLLRNSGLVANVFRRGVSGSLRRPRPLGRRRGWDAAFQQLEPRLALATHSGAVDATTMGVASGPRVARFIVQQGTYTENDIIGIRVKFTSPVTVEGSPVLPIRIGSVERDASLQPPRAGGSRVIAFTLSVQRGDIARDGLQLGSINLPAGATIRDRAGSDANVEISRVLRRVKVDAIGPRITEIGDLVVTPKHASIRVTFDEAVRTKGRGNRAPFVPVTIDGVEQRMTVAQAASRGRVVMFRYRAAAGERLDPANVAVTYSAVEMSALRVRDLAGNPAFSLSGPTDIMVSETTIPENTTSGLDRFILSAVDRDGGSDAQTYELVSGEGSADNGRFRIKEGRLVAAAPFDFESQSLFSIRLRATDSGGLSTERALTITVTDIAEAPTAARAGSLVGSTVFADWNGNGVHDWLDRDGNGVWNPGEGERWGRTDASGRVAFDAGDSAATLRVLGGRDTVVGTDLMTPLSAPAGSAVINSLTTLVVATQATSPGKSVAEAAEIVRDGLGLVPGVDLLGSDPLAANDVAVLRTEAVVAAVLATGEREGLATARVAENLARRLTSVAAQPPEAQPIDLRNVEELAAIFQAPGSPLPEATVARLANENSRVLATGSIDQLRQTRIAVETIRSAAENPTNRSLVGVDFSNAVLDGVDLASFDLRNANLRGAGLAQANLTGAALSGANLEGAALSSVDLRNANLAGATLAGANLGGASLAGANLSGANLNEATLVGANLSNANLSGADLRGAELDGANLAAAQLTSANLSGATLAPLGFTLATGTLSTARNQPVGTELYYSVTGSATGVVWGSDTYTDDSSLGTAAVHAGVLAAGQTGIVKVTLQGPKTSFPGTSRNGITTSPWGSWGGSFTIAAPGVPTTSTPANLAGANLSGASLAGANLNGATLAGATLVGTDLTGSGLGGANLSGANLSEVVLAATELGSVDLSNGQLAGANLGGASLAGANLSGANLNEATLVGANLSNANLSGADLRGAELDGANLAAAQLTSANLSGATLAPLGFTLATGTLSTARNQPVGTELYYSVTGSATGVVWGSDTYTDDSSLGTAAVHAGVLAAGQTGIVKVTLQGPKTSFPGTSRNGITTSPWGSWGGSFTIAAPGVPTTSTPANLAGANLSGASLAGANLNGATLAGATLVGTDLTGMILGAPSITSANMVRVGENGAFIHLMTAIPANASSPLGWSIHGGSDSALFQIDSVTGSLSFVAPRNFEAPTDMEGNNVYEVIVRVTEGTLATDQMVTVAVTDVNEAPTSVTVTSTVTSLAESTSTATRIKVADIFVTDDALGTNSITLTGADAASFEIVGSELFLKAGVTLNFEVRASYSVTVSVMDAALTGTSPVTAPLTLAVTDVNEPPTSVTLTGVTTSLDQETSTTTRTKVADIVVNDDAQGAVSIALTGTDASSFEVDGLSVYLRAGVVLDFATKPSYSVTVGVSDPTLPGSPAVTVPLTVAVEIRARGVLQAFSAHSTLPGALQETMSVIVGNRVYLFGGVNSSGMSTNQILSAQFDQSGQLGSFGVVTGNSLAVARHFGWASRIGDSIYVIGGFTGAKESGATSSVERAAINPDGTLGAFAVVPGVTLAAPRGGFAFINTGSYLTVTGGHSGNVANILASTERAVINSDGSIGTFQSVATPLTTGRWSMPGVRIANYFYVLGGEGRVAGGAISSLATIERATINADGTVGPFSVVSTQLSQPRNRSGYAVLYDKLYLFGGFTGTGFLTAVERGTISQTGELSGFGADSVSTLAEGLENGVTLQIRDQAIYYVGGYNYQNTSGVPRVQKAVILRVLPGF